MSSEVLIRELPRLPEDAPRVISPKMQELLTQLCFRKESQGKADVLFCFGTNKHYDRQAKIITDFLGQGYTKNVVIAGGKANYSDIVGDVVTESVQIISCVDTSRYPEVHFVLETESKNTYENVLFSLKKFDFSKCKHLHFSSQSFAAGRSYLTLRKFFPHFQITHSSFDILIPYTQIDITASNWHTTEFGIKSIWGEFLRICHYGARGDIAITEVHDLIHTIKNTY